MERQWRERFYRSVMKWAQERYIDEKDKRNAPKGDFVGITDHALIRYMERVERMDIEAIRKRMMDENLQTRVKKLGDGKYPMERFIAIVKNKTIVTIIPKRFREWRPL